MRRPVFLIALAAALGGCGDDGGGGASTTSSTAAVDRAALTAQIVDSVRGTVGDDGVPCVEDFLGERSDDDLDDLLNGGNDALNREFTDAVVACADD